MPFEASKITMRGEEYSSPNVPRISEIGATALLVLSTVIYLASCDVPGNPSGPSVQPTPQDRPNDCKEPFTNSFGTPEPGNNKGTCSDGKHTAIPISRQRARHDSLGPMQKQRGIQSGYSTSGSRYRR